MIITFTLSLGRQFPLFSKLDFLNILTGHLFIKSRSDAHTMGNYLALRSRVDESGVTADLTIANMIKFMIEFSRGYLTSIRATSKTCKET